MDWHFHRYSELNRAPSNSGCDLGSPVPFLQEVRVARWLALAAHVRAAHFRAVLAHPGRGQSLLDFGLHLCGIGRDSDRIANL